MRGRYRAISYACIVFNLSVHSEVDVAAMEVHRILGPGLLEGCYSDALCVELTHRGIECKREVPFPLFYKGVRIRDFYLDIVVEDRIVLELKAVKNVLPVHVSQILHYLKLSGIRVGYLINFGSQGLYFRRYSC